jgi:hypothetical protein
MYPLNLIRKTTDPMNVPAGFAVASDEAEHVALSALGYEPKFAAAEADPAEDDGKGHTVESVRAQLDAAGIAYDKRWGLAKLQGLLG